jgi:hypothetical protein
MGQLAAGLAVVGPSPIDHRLCRLVWIILQRGNEYIEYGEHRDPRATERRTARLVHQLRGLGYQIIPPAPGVVA